MKEINEKLFSITSKYGWQEYYNGVIAPAVALTYVAKRGESISDVPLEIIDLLLFLRRNKGMDILLAGINSDSSGDKTKKVKDKISLQSHYLLHEIEKYANTLLNDLIGGKYEALGIKYKELDDVGTLSYCKQYTDEELMQIREHESQAKNLRTIYSPDFKNPYFGCILNNWYEKFSMAGMFVAKKLKEETGDKAVGLKPEYMFLYDCMVIIGEYEEINDGQMKFAKVRDDFKSYLNHIKIKKERLK